jgi:hypothetical protein
MWKLRQSPETPDWEKNCGAQTPDRTEILLRGLAMERLLPNR